MIKVAIVDDNSIQIDMLGDILNDYIEIKKTEMTVKCFDNGTDLLEDVKQNGFYDIYILDMIMPGMNGMETATTLRMLNDSGKIIFLTSTVEYAVMSYDVKAFYYMVKPFDREKIYKVMDEACRDILKDEETISVKGPDGVTKIKLEQLLYIDIADRAPQYHLKNGKVVHGKLVRNTFKEVVDEVVSKPGFFLCGTSLVVNTHAIENIDSESLLMEGGVLLYPSKSGISELKKYLSK